MGGRRRVAGVGGTKEGVGAIGGKKEVFSIPGVRIERLNRFRGAIFGGEANKGETGCEGPSVGGEAAKEVMGETWSVLDVVTERFLVFRGFFSGESISIWSGSCGSGFEVAS
jgi:hypothetical protein